MHLTRLALALGAPHFLLVTTLLYNTHASVGLFYRGTFVEVRSSKYHGTEYIKNRSGIEKRRRSWVFLRFEETVSSRSWVSRDWRNLGEVVAFRDYL